MYEYLQALHRRFFQEPEHGDLNHDIETARQKLAEHLDKPQRILLLRLLDVESRLKNEVSLESFAAGFKLAAGIARELEADGLYSYEEEINERIAQGKEV